ncbi:hypothetical protein IFR05_012976 [Cadophora sp. M221]|nr:hypothetical protein IFR05_012976 [Cadophora sp. M221]
MASSTPPGLHNEVYPFISPAKFANSLDSQVVLIIGNRKAVITSKFVPANVHYQRPGAAGTIGSSISKCFSIAGATVYLLDYNTEPLAALEKKCQKLGAKATYSAQIDIANYEVCEAVIKKVKEDCGAIDVLVNSAGVGRLGVDIKWFNRGIAINFTGPMFLMHLVLPDFIARRRGCIINIASRHGTVSTPLMCDYNTSKAALIRLTQCIQAEVDMYQASDIHLYALHPGGIRSNISTEAPLDSSIVEEFPAGMVSVALATGIGKQALRGRYVDCGQDLEGIISQETAFKADPELHSLNMKFLGGLLNDEGGANLTLEEPFVMPSGFE